MKPAERFSSPAWPKIGAGLAVLACVAVMALAIFMLNRPVIWEGITINGIEVGGKTKQEAIDELRAVMEPFLERERLKVTCGENLWQTSLKDLGGSFDYARAVDEAYSIGREASPIKNIKELLEVRRGGRDLQLEFSFDYLALRAFLENIDRQIAIPPADATIIRNGEEFTVTPETYGIGVDIDTAVRQIGRDLKEMDLSEKQLPLLVKIPEVTADMLKAIDTRWGMFSTRFNAENVNRTKNILLAASAIEGTLLKPGAVFSFNETTGPRTSENGYLDAPVIFKGELVPGTGGGVCQVSSTLYNAVLYANLEIVERHHHSIPSTYIDLGRDATVAGNVLDFKFRNNTDYYIYIASWVQGDRIYAAVYGPEREENLKVKIRTQIVEVIDTTTEIVTDPTLREGEEVVEREGRKGYKVKTYRQVFQGNQMVDEKLISFDYYRPEKRVIRRGPISADAGAEKLDDSDDLL